MMIFVFTMFKAELLCGSFAFFGYSVIKPERIDMLACQCAKGLMTRPSMRMERGEATRESELK